MFFEDNIDDAKYCGHLYGLGASFVQNGTNSCEQANSTFNATTQQNSHPSANNGETTLSTPTTLASSSWPR